MHCAENRKDYNTCPTRLLVNFYFLLTTWVVSGGGSADRGRSLQAPVLYALCHAIEEALDFLNDKINNKRWQLFWKSKDSKMQETK